MNFGLYFLALFTVAWSCRGNNEWRKILILVASWIFYGAWSWNFVALLIFSAVFNWAIAAGLGEIPLAKALSRRIVLTIGIVVNLTILATFKYLGFFTEQMHQILNDLGWSRDFPVL